MPATTNEHAGSSQRYQMLDVWRGVVSLVVVVEHVGVALWPSGDTDPALASGLQRAVVTVLGWNVGTPLFFVMSGYCIAASLVSSRRRGVSPLTFLGRRLWRIYPTYWVALLGFVVFAMAVDSFGLTRLRYNSVSQQIGSPAELNFAQWLGNLTLTETWRPRVGGTSVSSVYTRVAWSLCYQEQFYVVCVLVLWLAPARLGRALAAVTAVIVLVRVEAWDIGFYQRIDGFFPVYWHEFAVGLAVYWRLTGAGAATLAARRALELFIGAMLVASFYYGCVSTVAASGLGLLLIALYRWDHVTGELAWLSPVRAVGRRSFSIYLTHLPVVAAGNQLMAETGLAGFWPRALVLVPVVTVASVAVGWAFHHAVERRFLTPPQFSRFKVGARECPLAALPA